MSVHIDIAALGLGPARGLHRIDAHEAIGLERRGDQITLHVAPGVTAHVTEDALRNLLLSYVLLHDTSELLTIASQIAKDAGVAA